MSKRAIRALSLLASAGIHRRKRQIACKLAMAMAFTGMAVAQNTNTTSGSKAITQGAGTYDELKQLLKTRYDQKTVVAEISGLYAGEQKKGDFGIGPGENGLIWSHFVANMQVPNRISTGPFQSQKASDMNQLDDHTFGALSKGLNVSVVQKGESLKVYKFYVYPDYIELVLSTTGLGHLLSLA